MTEDLRIRVELDSRSIEWDDVLECLVQRYKIKAPQARQMIKSFIRRVSRFGELSWFRSPILEDDDEKISTCLAGHYCADTLAITRRAEILSNWCRLTQTIKIQPWPPSAEESAQIKTPTEEVTPSKKFRGVQSATIVVALFGRDMTINRLHHAVLLHLCFSLFGVFFYALLVGLLLYGTAVLLLFIEEPEVMTVAITRNVELFLGLVSLLVFLAAIWGRAVSNLISLAREKMSSLLESQTK